MLTKTQHKQAILCFMVITVQIMLRLYMQPQTEMSVLTVVTQVAEAVCMLEV